MLLASGGLTSLCGQALGSCRHHMKYKDWNLMQALAHAGCSKTRMAQAAAGSSGMRLQPLAGVQLFSMYIGEGEAALRDAFQRARLSAPAIIFIDEIDAIVGVFPFYMCSL